LRYSDNTNVMRTSGRFRQIKKYPNNEEGDLDVENVFH